MSRARKCYSRNGTLITDIAYKPCGSDPERDTFCCGTNHQGAGHRLVSDDVCEFNGLCQNYEPYDGKNEGVKLWWRQGCTDETWESKYCLKDVCNYGTWQDDNGFAPVRYCGENHWCCGEKECCDVNSSLFTLAATVGVTSASSTLSSQSTSSMISTQSTPAPSSVTSTSESASTSLSATPFSNNLVPPTTASTNSPISASSTAAPAAPSTGLSTPIRAGIGVGAAILFLLLLLIALLLYKLKQKRQYDRAQAIELSGDSLHEKDQSDRYAHLAVPPVELHGSSRPWELDVPMAELGIREDVRASNERREVGIREDVIVRGMRGGGNTGRGLEPGVDPRYPKAIALP